MITNIKKTCPGCIKLNKKSFAAFKADVSDILKSVHPPFLFCQADIFGPIMASQDGTQLKRWVLVVLCLSSRAVHLEILHNYSSQSITRGFRRTFAFRGTPRIIWIDARLNIVKAGKDLINTEMKVISALNIKFYPLSSGLCSPSTTPELEQWRESFDLSRTLSGNPSQVPINSRRMMKNSSPGSTWSKTSSTTVL